MKKPHLSLLTAFVGGFIAILTGLVLYQMVSEPAAPPADLPVLWPNPKQLQAFELTDQQHMPFNLDRVKGKWTFWFFGYTHCPDICPVTLSVMNEVEHKLESNPALKEKVQTAFVSVDPGRDTLEQLRTYLGFFNPRFVGTTGSDEALEALTRQFGILYLLQEPDEAGSYLVDHTAAILLTDPAARFVALFSAPHNAADIESKFRRIVAFIGG